jgi:hypothetical protein
VKRLQTFALAAHALSQRKELRGAERQGAVQERDPRCAAVPRCVVRPHVVPRVAQQNEVRALRARAVRQLAALPVRRYAVLREALRVQRHAALRELHEASRPAPHVAPVGPTLKW